MHLLSLYNKVTKLIYELCKDLSCKVRQFNLFFPNNDTLQTC